MVAITLAVIQPIMAAFRPHPGEPRYLLIIIIIIIFIRNQHILLITVPTIKILFTINSIKKTIPSNNCLQILSFKKTLS